MKFDFLSESDQAYHIHKASTLVEAFPYIRQHSGKNVTIKYGDGYQGWLEYAPFDAIIVTAAPDQLPKALIEQLKPEGRLVIPVGTFYQELKVITKGLNKQIQEENIIPVRFVPMVHPKENIFDKKP